MVSAFFDGFIGVYKTILFGWTESDIYFLGMLAGVVSPCVIVGVVAYFLKRGTVNDSSRA